MDLFSSLDYKSTKLKIFNSYLVWLVSFVWVLYFMGSYNISYKHISSNMSYILMSHYKMVKVGVFSIFSGSYLVMWSMFFFMVMSNFLGMVYCVFGGTTQVVLSVSLSFSVWVCFILSSIMYKFNSFVGHLTPTGSPLSLLFLLKKMELLSKFMRFMTLSLRLSIKISTGHMFVSLLSFSGLYMIMGLMVNWYVGFMVLMLFFYAMFELGVCCLQGFVFSLLLAQYLGEHS